MATSSSAKTVAAEDSPSEDDVVIALMGVTGAGKSTFIKRVTGREDVIVGHDLTSETIECRPYRVELGGVHFVLIDSPGFNDTYLDDAAILTHLALFMENSYRANTKITAIIYIHPIINTRLEGSALDNLSMFRKLCGKDCYPNIVLATSFWSKVDLDLGEKRVAELEQTEEFWGGMVRRGSQIVRLPDEKDACIKLLLQLAKRDKIVLQIQDELVNKHLTLHETTAGASARNAAALEATRAQYLRKLDLLALQKRSQLEKQEMEMTRLRAEQEAEFQRQLSEHQKEVEEARQRHRALLAETDAKRQEALQEQEKLKREVEEETRRLQEELRNMELKSRQNDLIREQTRRKQISKDRVKAMNTNLARQVDLVSTAGEAGTVRAHLSAGWTNDPGIQIGRICDTCLHPCSTQISYTCRICEDHDLCQPCFDAGERCFDSTHWPYARWNRMGTEAGQCKRAKYPTRPRYRIPCDQCGVMLDGIYFHCCSCNGDNYDLCCDCVVQGRTCLDRSHVLQLFQTGKQIKLLQ